MAYASVRNRYPWLVTLGASVLAWTGGRMIAMDPVMHRTVLVEFSVNLWKGPLGFVLASLSTAIVRAVHQRHRVLERPGPEHRVQYCCGVLLACYHLLLPRFAWHGTACASGK